MKALPIVIMSLAALLPWYPARRTVSFPPPPQPPGPYVDSRDIEDRDFVAKMFATKDPNVFLIEVKLINPKVDKAIYSHERVFVDFALTSIDGTILSGPPLEQTYAAEVNYSFDPTDAKPELNYKRGYVRLLTWKCPPDLYRVEPKVRIVEVGEDSVHGPYTDMGSVAVPAGNSVQITVAKRK
jgi:hypothetical protein